MKPGLTRISEMQKRLSGSGEKNRGKSAAHGGTNIFTAGPTTEEGGVSEFMLEMEVKEKT